MNAGQSRRWYQEPMVWMVIAIPAVSVVLGISLVVLATKTWDGLVVDDYYKEGLAVNQKLERQQKAVAYGLSAIIELDPENGGLTVALQGDEQFVIPSHVDLSMHHATRSGHDYSEQLAIGRDGLYNGPFAELVPGRWNVLLQTSEWRIAGSLQWPTESNTLVLESIAGEGS